MVYLSQVARHEANWYMEVASQARGCTNQIIKKPLNDSNWMASRQVGVYTLLTQAVIGVLTYPYTQRVISLLCHLVFCSMAIYQLYIVVSSVSIWLPNCTSHLTPPGCWLLLGLWSIWPFWVSICPLSHSGQYCQALKHCTMTSKKWSAEKD